VDNFNNIICEARRHFKNKKMEYLKDKIKEVATNSNKNIRDLYRGLNEFKRGYQPRNNLVKHKNVHLLADSHILNRWKKNFSQLLNVYSISNVKQTEIHTAKP
jgi:di/tripeptidase